MEHTKKYLEWLEKWPLQYEKQKARMREYSRTRRATLKAHGICTRCGKEDAMKGYTICAACNLWNNQIRSGYTGRKMRRPVSPKQ